MKSNAYGHGLKEVVRLFQTSGRLPSVYTEGNLPEVWFGVDSVDEALTLKKTGVKNSVLILGYIPIPRLAEAIKNGFRFALYDTDVLKESVRIAKKLRKKAHVHIKVETGTYRQGIVCAHIPVFASFLRKHARYIISEGIYTHFADTENEASLFYKEQLQAFQECVSLFAELGIVPPYRHEAASAAILTYADTHATMVRLGISLYGMYPSEDVKHLVSDKLRLQPALTWKTRVAQVKDVPKGATIGYDRAFTALKPMKLAVLPVGYWDGYDRKQSNKGSVLIGGKKCSVVGNICMNIIMADVTGVPRVAAGDEAVLLGRQGSAEITAEEFAAKIGTINYEVTTRINPLLPRIVV